MFHFLFTLLLAGPVGEFVGIAQGACGIGAQSGVGPCKGAFEEVVALLVEGRAGLVLFELALGVEQGAEVGDAGGGVLGLALLGGLFGTARIAGNDLGDLAPLCGVLLSSLTAFQGSPYVATYGASKSFDLALAEGLCNSVLLGG